MEDLTGIIAILCVFGTPVAIVWMVLRHRREQRAEKQATSTASAELTDIAHRMEQRIEALEQILDAEAPGWRKRHHE